ncbi:HD-GYP domain-containing protein [Clostridium oryzae]|uniref:Cyclic di-GMP phosphodiesterase response regulator RpfG n=1 Tax=Clostridium oryzae TaxID=1450648 RepID=A0A1V4IQF6_9CLOT|nr:HD-GYP domain-containing protein [Clostridium oryzae]OPJ62242.1 cyclic di-GMP phosphodiesterase response regulator RpfG [Clostridium oryzae]
MLANKKTVAIDKLEPGMISASDINVQDKVLVAKGVAITESAIERLKQSYIVDKIDIYVDEEIEEAMAVKKNTVEEIHNNFNEFASNLKDIFTNIDKLKSTGMDDVRAFTRKIQDEFKATGLVIRDIVLNGSGNDSIYRHSVNVSAIGFILGKWLGLNERDLNLLTYSAILHDMGKTELSDRIIANEGRLTSDEFAIFKQHPVIAYNIVKQIPYLDPSVSYGVLMHHERGDGSGYPLGIKEDKIHKFAKILAIADMFDELSSGRSEKECKGPFDTLQILHEESLGKLDPTYCDMFINHIVNYFMGEMVLLNDKRTCKVIQVQMNDLTRPLLLDDNGFLDLRNEKDLFVEKLLV